MAMSSWIYWLFTKHVCGSQAFQEVCVPPLRWTHQTAPGRLLISVLHAANLLNAVMKLPAIELGRCNMAYFAEVTVIPSQAFWMCSKLFPVGQIFRYGLNGLPNGLSVSLSRWNGWTPERHQVQGASIRALRIQRHPAEATDHQWGRRSSEFNAPTDTMSWSTVLLLYKLSSSTSERLITWRISASASGLPVYLRIQYTCKLCVGHQQNQHVNTTNYVPPRLHAKLEEKAENICHESQRLQAST